MDNTQVRPDQVLRESEGRVGERPVVLKSITGGEGTVYLTEKHIDLIKDPGRFQIIEGKTGSSKSIIGGIAAFHRIFKSPKEQNQFVIAATSIDTIERMVVDNKASFFNIYKKVCVYKASGVGGARIEIATPTGIKKLYFAGYDNAARYKKILGLTISGFILEEAHVAPDNFIGELFTRLYRNDSWMYATMNAGLPDQFVYMNYFNKARPRVKWAHHVPGYMWEELEKLEHDPNFIYWFFTFEDNPTMSDKQIEELWGAHVPGTYEYNSKVLARRGFVEGLLYARLLDNVHEFHIRDIDKIIFEKVYVGIDIGATDKTIFVLLGMAHNSNIVRIIDVHEVRYKVEGEQDYSLIIKQFDEFIDQWISKVHISQVRIDRADPLFRNQLRNNSKHRLSYQASRSDRISERITLKQQLLMQGRMHFSDTPGSAKLVNALRRVRSDGKDGHIDEDTPEIDYSDALDYALEPISFTLSTSKVNI